MDVAPAHAVLLEHEGRHLAFTRDRGRILLAAGDGRFTALDAALRPVHRGLLPGEAGAVALHPRGDLLALAAPEELVVADLCGVVVERRPHRRWEDFEGGAVAFAGGGEHLLAVLPRSEDEAVTVALLRPGEHRAIAEAMLDVPEPSGFSLLPTPDPALWALWAGAQSRLPFCHRAEVPLPV